MTTNRQCPSCGGFCKKSGCERENVQPEQRAWAEGYEKGRLQREWQGLTDEEANELTYASIAEIEAKLKEKNT